MTSEQRKLLRAALANHTNGTVGDKTPKAKPLASVSLTCRYLGDRIPGQPCGSQLFRCNKFDEVTTRFVKCSSATRHCATCEVPEEERSPPIAPSTVSTSPITTRHLVYHVYPSQKTNAWKRGIDQLRMRWPLFNGVKLFAIMTGAGLVPPDQVVDYLPRDCEVVRLKNDPSLREVVSWPLLWGKLLSKTRTGAALYAHTKGATRPDDAGNSCHWWASLLYSLSLDNWGIVSRQLMRYPITGSFKKVGRGFTGSRSRWHYSGSFFWARLDDFANRPWNKIDHQWWGNESWPGTAYNVNDAGCVFHEGFVPKLDLYDPIYWKKVVRPSYAEWFAKKQGVLV